MVSKVVYFHFYMCHDWLWLELKKHHTLTLLDRPTIRLLLPAVSAIKICLWIIFTNTAYAQMGGLDIDLNVKDAGVRAQEHNGPGRSMQKLLQRGFKNVKIAMIQNLWISFIPTGVLKMA